MAINLNAAQVQALRGKFSPEQIRGLQLGRLDPMTTALMLSVAKAADQSGQLNFGPSDNAPTQQAPTGGDNSYTLPGRETWDLNTPLNVPKGYVFPQNTNPFDVPLSQAGMPQPQGYVPTPWGQSENYGINRRGTPQAPQAPIGGGGASSGPSWGQGLVDSIGNIVRGGLAGLGTNSGGGYTAPDMTIPGLGPPPDIPTYDPLPAFPNLPELQIPQIVMRDYMPQATEAMNAAYAPLFSGLEESRTNTQQAGDRANAMVGGAYNNAINTIAQNAAQNQQDNQAAQQKNTDQGAQLAQQVGQNYAGNNANVANILQGLGIQAAAPQVLGTAANEASWQQGQAQQRTANQGDYLANQGAADQKYATDMQNTTANASAVATSDIANQVQQNLFSLDQLKSGYDSEKVKQAISMAMGLTSQDVDVQKANASNSVTVQQQALENILKGYEAQVLGSNTSNAQKQQAFDNINKVRQEAIDRFQWEKTFEQTDAKNWLDQQNKILEGTSGSGSGSDNAPKPPESENIRNYFEMAYPGQGAIAVDAAFELLQQFKNPDHPKDPQTFPQYQERVRFELAKRGIDLSLADRIAVEVFNTSKVPTGLSSSSTGG